MRAGEHGARRAVPARVIGISDHWSVIIAAKDGRIELDIIELVALGVAIKELVALRIRVCVNT